MTSHDASDLPTRWAAAWPGTPPIAHELPAAYPKQWVRFHSLPGSKRYPTDEAEYAIVLQRHNTVLDELFADAAIHIVTAAWSDDAMVPDLTPDHERVHPNSRPWTSVREPFDDDTDVFVHLFISDAAWQPGLVDPLLRSVADDELAAVFVTDANLRRIYHPYDGGADVILATSAERDALRDRHATWLPTP